MTLKLGGNTDTYLYNKTTRVIVCLISLMSGKERMNRYFDLNEGNRSSSGVKKKLDELRVLHRKVKLIAIMK